jgi:cytochrome P450
MQQSVDTYAWYKMMRQTNPVAYNADYQSWSVFRYNDVQRVLSDTSAFSSQFMGSGEQDNAHPLGTSIINTDPPRHRKLRNLVTLAFTPRTVARLAPRISAIVNDLVNRVEHKGAMDIIDDLSYPLPVTVIAEMLGIPHEDRERFKHWSDELVGATHTPGTDPEVEMSRYFTHMIELRRQDPQDDLISDLIAAQIDGEHLTMTELLGFCILLLVAGNETTTHLIGNAILCFDEHPGTLEQLRAEPALIPDALEEVLRYRSPVRCMFRRVAVDTTIGDKEVKAGQHMNAWIASANRDEEQFPNADQFDIRRTPNRHLAFGYGIHFCIGAPLARLEAKIALEILLERLPGLKIKPDATVEPMPSMILQGVKHLPVTFEPQSVSSPAS